MTETTETTEFNQTQQKPHQRVAAVLLERTIARHASAGGYVDVRSVLSDRTIPAVVTRFLDLELRFSIARGVAPLRERFRIDQRLESPAVETFTTGLMLTSTMPISEFADAFASAMEVAHAYLVRPEQTLAALLTNNEAETKLDKRFFDILEHAAEYQYLSEITLAWAERLRAAGVTHVDEVTLYRQFRKIHRGVLGNFPVSEIGELLGPLYDLYSLAEIRSIERTVLEDFFSDRGMSAARNRIEFSGAETLTMRELQMLLDDLLRGEDPPKPVDTSVPLETIQFDPSTQTPEQPPTSYDDFIRDLKSAGIPVVTPKRNSQSNIQSFDLNRAMPAPEEQSDNSSEQAPLMKLAEQDSVGMIEVEVIELPAESPRSSKTKEVLALPPSSAEAKLPTMGSMIEPDLRRKFIRKLFEDNDTDYKRYVTLLNQTESWKQASIYVDAIFLRHRINPYSKTAIRFSDLVYSRFVRSEK